MLYVLPHRKYYTKYKFQEVCREAAVGSAQRANRACVAARLCGDRDALPHVAPAQTIDFSDVRDAEIETRYGRGAA